MVRLRSSRHLSCFYCGKRSGIRFDGSVRQFDCPSCEATNYLDANGDITDPPVATQGDPEPAVQYAAPRAASPSESIFCATCLKNQRLFTASLAQYMADDPTQDDSLEAERKYIRYRRSLEKRYPQVCADCSWKVDEAINKAKYTAKTDHLRRMMERTRGRKTVSRNTTLDWFHSAGRALWWGGLMLQMLWHIKAVSSVLMAVQSDRVMYDPDDDGSSIVDQVTTGIGRLGSLLPAKDIFVNASVAFTITSAWWNPQFVSVSRGFTKHLMGVRQWYSFQGLIIMVRLACRSLIDMTLAKEHPKSAQLSAHLAIASFTSLICFMASRSIKVDTTPLFGTHSGSVTPMQHESPLRSKREETLSFSEALNDALSSSSPQPIPSWPSSPAGLRNPQHSPSTKHNNFQSTDDYINPANLRISDAIPNPKIEQVAYGDEMDWSPTQSHTQTQTTHRAFQDSPSRPGNQPRAFGQAPIDPNAGAFWYKVPPAPVNPAQKLRNPQMQPMLRRPVEKKNAFFQRSKGEDTTVGDGISKKKAVEFQQQRFFTANDDDSGLTNMMAQSFTLGDDEDATKAVGEATSGENGTVSRVMRVARWRNCQIEAIGLVGLLIVWLLRMAIPVAYAMEIQLGLLFLSGIVAVAAAGREQTQSPSTLSLVDSALSVAELAGVAWIGWETWIGNEEASIYGVGAFGTMLLHRIGYLCMN